MIKIAVVEDDKKASANLVGLIEEYIAQNNVQCEIVEFASGISFLDQYKADFDIVFLDINMPNMDGIEVSRELRKADSHVIIIFVTDMAQYAIKGYEVSALDFIVKPVKLYGLSKALSKAITLVEEKDNRDLILKHNGTVYRIKISDILYIEVARHHLVYHTAVGDIEGWGALDSVEKSLPSGQFFRLHSAYIVALRYVVKVDGGDVILKDGTRLKISRNRKNDFMAAIARFFGER